jgi:hypothetical protein
MAKRPQSPKRSSAGSTSAPSSAASAPGPLEERVLAFAEQLGRIAGTLQARTAGWMEGDALKKELTGIRDGAADLVHQMTSNESPRAKRKTAGTSAPRGTQGRSGGIVDAPGKQHRRRLPADPDATRATSQSAKMRAAKTMTKTPRHRGRG